MRLASLGASLVLGLFIYVIRYRAGLIGRIPLPRIIRILAWVVTGYMALNTLGNFASINPIEQMLFGSLTFIMTFACLILPPVSPDHAEESLDFSRCTWMVLHPLKLWSVSLPLDFRPRK